MKNYTKIFVLFCILNFTFFTSFVYATTYTWLGATSTAWNLASNWSPSTGYPNSGDWAIIETHTNLPLLDTTRSVTNLTVTSGTLNLNGFTLTVNGVSLFSSGSTVTNGTLCPNGTQSTYASGCTINAIVTSTCGKVYLNGGTFSYAVTIVDTSTAYHYGNGGNTFQASVTLTHASSCGAGQWGINNTIGNTFNGDVTLIQHATGSFFVSGNGTTYYNGNVIVGSDNKDINIGGTSGGLTYLASGKTISIDGTTGFSNGTLLLRDFVQQGGTSQSLTLTGTAILNLISSTFNGAVTFSSASVLFKTSTFNASASLTQTGSTSSNSDGGNIFNSTASILNPGGAAFRMGGNGDDVFNDNVILSGSGAGELQPAHGRTLIAKGNVTLSGKVQFNHGVYSMLKLTGTAAQTLTTSNHTFYDFKIDKDSNNVTLSGIMNIADTMRFVKGLLITTSSNLLSLNSTSAVTGTSNNSFISGPVAKKGNTAFVFPIGKGSTYRAIEMTAPSGSNTQVFTGEYFNSAQSLGTSMDTSVKYISSCDYWNFTRSNSTANPTVKLSYDSTSCGQLDSATLKVANWNGTKWKDLGNGGITGNRYVGKVANSTTVVTYGNFALSYNQCFLTANAGSDQAFCQSDSVTVGASPTASLGTGTYTYTWTPTNALSSSTIANPKASPTSSTDYVVTVTDVAGCSLKDTIALTYHARPTASAGTDQSYCSGDSATIGGSPTASGGGTPYTYIWSPSTGLSSTTTANPKASPSSTSSYIVTVTDNYGCTKQDTVAVINSIITYTWTGASTTAWTDTHSWSPMGVPGSCDNVIIVTGSNNVLVSTNTTVRQFTINSGTVDIQTKVLTITGKAFFNSGTVQNGSIEVTNTDTASFNGTQIKTHINVTASKIFLNGSIFYNPASLSQTGSNNTYSSGGNTFKEILDFQNTGSGNIYLANSNPDNYYKNTSFSTTGNGTIYPAYTKNSTFKGNIGIYYSSLPSNGPMRFGLNGGKVIFNGLTNDTISATLTSGSADTLMTFKKIEVNQPGGGIVLNKKISITDSLILYKGNITSTSANLLIMNAGSVVTGASDSSLVNGPIQKIGNSVFIFPTGKGNNYRAIEISAPSNIADAYTGEYFDTAQTLGTAKDTTINFISDCNYWSLLRNNGISLIKVKCYWNSQNCGAFQLDSMYTAKWNGARWTNQGNGGIAGNEQLGNIVTSFDQDSLGFFAISYILIPHLQFEFTRDTLFKGSEITFTNLSTGFPNNTQYIWNFGDTCGSAFLNGNDSLAIVKLGSLCNDSINNKSSVIHIYDTYNYYYFVSLSAIDLNSTKHLIMDTVNLYSDGTLDHDPAPPIINRLVEENGILRIE